MGSEARTLRGVLKDNITCKGRFEEAEALAKSIFDPEKHDVLPFYTEHGQGHCRKLEQYLDEIIWAKNGELGRHDFDPSSEEAMYLLSAVWLHDIGMWHRILDSDQADELRDTAKVIALREKHEDRTARYILDKWTDRCSWPPDEKDWLSEICVHHRRKHPISQFQPFKESGRYKRDGEIRLGVLAALLRLADACHVDKSRAPQRVMRLYISLGMPQEARDHWERADLIQDIIFDHIERSIVLKGHYPPTVDFALGEFDLREVGEIICENIREELRSVQQTLSHFPNTSFQKVKHITRSIRARGFQQKRQCLHLWPYLLNRPFSATEAAAALAQMLLLSTENAEESRHLGDVWHKDMVQIMEKTKDLHPHDFMIRNLCIGVQNILADLPKKAISATKLTKYLNRFVKAIDENSSRLVGRARKLIGDNDVLVLCGHSVNVERLLRDIDKNRSLYIINCYKPFHGHKVFDEDKKLVESVKKLGFGRYKFLQLASLAEALGELKRKKIPCKLLLGTHGRLKGGDLLCKVGSNILATTARQFGAEVIAFCEEAKFLVNGIEDDEIAGPEQLFSSDEEKMHPDMVDVPCVAPKMDRVPKRLVDMVVTEKRVERKPKRARRAAGASKSRATGKKANKAR